MAAPRLSAAACALALGLAAPPLARAADCGDLKGLRLQDVEITAATAVTPAPTWSPPPQRSYNGAVSTPFCRVEGTIGGGIGFELWLPAPERWTGRFLGAGVGGDAGIFNYADLARGVARGYASATTDSGHKITEPHWMLDAVKVENYAHRAEHLMTVTGKAIAAAYYGKPAAYSYFIGCSGGGRQALKEMQAYPADYDGVVAGAPGPYMMIQSARFMAIAVAEMKHPQAALTDADWDLVTTRAVSDCDGRDGVVDGVVEQPLACRFELDALECGKLAGRCLTPAQIAMVKWIYAPLKDSAGRDLDSGLVPGVRTRPGPPSPLLRAMFADGAHKDVDWDAMSFDVTRDLDLVRKAMPTLAADQTDLSGFKARGGKFILYQGWMDPSIGARQSLDYYGRVRARMGGEAADSFTRLFLAPGVLHCGGGAGPDLFGGSGRPAPVDDPDHDLLAAIVAWVEQDRAPERIIASKVVDEKVVRTRPLCAWPKVARYKGTGDTDEAASFTCEKA